LTSHVQKEKSGPESYVVTRSVKVPSGRVLLDLKRGEVISDPSLLKTLRDAFEGHPPIRRLLDTDLV
jgi:hypothetical protein